MATHHELPIGMEVVETFERQKPSPERSALIGEAAGLLMLRGRRERAEGLPLAPADADRLANLQRELGWVGVGSE